MKKNGTRPAALCLAAALMLGLGTLPARAATPETAAGRPADRVDGPTGEKEDRLSLNFDIQPFGSAIEAEVPLAPVRDLTVTGGAEGSAYTYEEGVLTLRSGDLTVSMPQGAEPSAHRIVVAGGYTGTLTLEGVNLDQGTAGTGALTLEPGANVELKLIGVNTLNSGGTAAGVEVPAGAALTLTGAGDLTAWGGTWGEGGGAGIGGSGAGVNFGTITLRGTGTLEAVGGNRAAGIGSGGRRGAGTTVTGTVRMESGTVDASGGPDAAGVGCGPDLVCQSQVQIAGGRLTARGGTSGPGVGSGTNSDNQGRVQITGGRLTAWGGRNGAGVGGGWSTGAGTVEITGGVLTARGGSGNAAGIGGGLGADGGSLALQGGTVFAQGSTPEQDIGCTMTTPDGQAVLYAQGFRHTENQADWSCLVLGDGTARWYGSGNTIRSALPLTLTGGQTLTVPADGTLQVEGTLTLQSGNLQVRGSCTVRGIRAEAGTALTVEPEGYLLNHRETTLAEGAALRNGGEMTLLGDGENRGRFVNDGTLVLSRFRQAGGSFTNTARGVVEVDGGSFEQGPSTLTDNGLFLSVNGGQIQGPDLGAYECRILFDGNGGTPDTEDLVTRNRQLTALPGATRQGQRLEGWYTRPRGGERVTDDRTFPVGTTLYAHWAPAQTPTPAVTSTPVPAATPTPAPAVTPAPTAAPGTTATPAPTAAPAAPTPDPTRHLLRFETNGGFPVDSLSVGRGARVELWPYNPTRTGYLFAGWYADQALTQPVKEMLMNGDKTVYAAWKADPAAATPAPAGKNTPRAAGSQAGGKAGSKGGNKGSGQGKAAATPAPTPAVTPGPTPTPVPTATARPTPAPTAEAAMPETRPSLPLWPLLGFVVLVAPAVTLLILRRRR